MVEIMEILRNEETIKLEWKSKINIKTTKKDNKEYVQYTVNLPSFLVKLFDLQKDTEYCYERWLIFYNFKGKWYLGKHTYWIYNEEKDFMKFLPSYESTAYNTGGNVYRLTLRKEIFDEWINKDKDNYLLFSLDTNKFSEHDNLSGVVSIDVLN